MIARLRHLALLLPVSLALGGPLAVAAPPTPDAKALYERDCVKCHQSEIFTRPDRIIHSLPALAARVRWCETNTGQQWTDQEIAAVTTYLNDNFYHFRP
ncbi:cytochrome c [uncultured Thiodictyon sp.]|uniref:cytochrome c n=1 Tax=uncultured Thiodictyon sp. TaxID=1846217 RepID=UPI0025FBC506|nr:cytochrome c [uncultured Thiodictyon sp.]